GKALMTSLMKQHSVMSLEQLLYSAADQGVRFVACTTSMSIMGITKGDLIAFEGLSYGGVASFAQDAAASDLHLSF
ncbi:MAG: DsrE/DsrF/DrsH-like family protein, partial [Myxococcota bacterium]